MMKIVEAGTIAKTDDGTPITGIVIAASKDEIASLPFNPYGAFVKLVKDEQHKRPEPAKKTEPAKGKGK